MDGVQLYGRGGSMSLLSGPDSAPNFSELMRSARGWVYACTRVIAEEVGMTPVKLFRVKKDGDEIVREPVGDHELLDLLNSPNPYMTGFEMMETISMHLDLTGNCFLWMDGVKSASSKPTVIWPLPPDQVKPVRAALPSFIRSYLYRHDAVERVLSTEEVLHVKEPNPNDLYMGLGPVEAAWEAIRQDAYARLWNRNFFENGASSSTMLKSESPSADINKKILNSFVENYSGVGRAHKVGILPKGVALEKNDMSVKDMDFVNLRVQMRDEILGLMRVPHVVLGLGAGESLNRATADTTDYVFARRTIRPRLRRLSAYLNEFLVPRFGKDLVLEFKDPVPEDSAEKRALHREGLGNQPYLTVNEVRNDLGMPDVEGGDTVNEGSGFFPLGEDYMGGGDAEDPAEEAQARSVRKGLKGAGGRAVRKKSPATRPGAMSSAPNRFWKNAARREEQMRDMTAKAVEEAKAIMADAVKGHSRQQRARYVKAASRRAHEGQKPLKQAMDRYHAGLVERVLSALPSVEGKSVVSKAGDVQVLNRSDEIEAVIDAVTPVMERLALDQAIAAGDFVGASFDAGRTWNRALARTVGRLARRYTGETVDALRSALDEGISAGEGLDDLARRVREFGEWSDDVRSMRLAKTETFRAVNLGARASWEQSGVVQTLQWFVQSDNPCEFCQAQDGKEVGVSDDFYAEGDTIHGSSGGTMDVTYAAGSEPNLHPNCECVILPGKVSVNQ